MTVRNRPYQRRRRGPVLLLVAVLAVVVTVTWTTVLVKSGSATGVAASSISIGWGARSGLHCRQGTGTSRCLPLRTVRTGGRTGRRG